MIIKVKVKANAKKSEIKKEDDFYIVSVKSPAHDNKANIEVVRLLTKYFKKRVRMIKGLKSKEKLLSLESSD